jgi:hypothetical protein
VGGGLLCADRRVKEADRHSNHSNVSDGANAPFLIETFTFSVNGQGNEFRKKAGTVMIRDDGMKLTQKFIEPCKEVTVPAPKRDKSHEEEKR